MKARSLLFKALALVFIAPVAQAQDDWKTWPTGERWQISAGYFAPDLDTTVKVTDEDGNIGTGISFEQNLGLDDNKGTFLASVGWRFAKRHKLSYSYFELNRSSASSDSTVTIVVGDDVFDVELPIRSFFDVSANEIAYSYSILFREKTDLYVGIGISLQDLALGLQGTASSPNPGEILNETVDQTAPLPTLNAGFNYAFSDKWILESKLGWLAVDANLEGGDALDGQIISANLGIRWKAFRNVGFYAQYQLFDVDVDYLERGVKFAVNYDYQGPLVGVAVNF